MQFDKPRAQSDHDQEKHGSRRLRLVVTPIWVNEAHSGIEHLQLRRKICATMHMEDLPVPGSYPSDIPVCICVWIYISPICQDQCLSLLSVTMESLLALVNSSPEVLEKEHRVEATLHQ